MGLRFVGESDTCRDVVPGWKLDGNQGIVDGFTCERQGSEPAWLRRSGTGKDSLMSERVIGLVQRSRSGARDRILLFSISVPQVLNSSTHYETCRVRPTNTSRNLTACTPDGVPCSVMRMLNMVED
jgi:hypothetical protein